MTFSSAYHKAPIVIPDVLTVQSYKEKGQVPQKAKLACAGGIQWKSLEILIRVVLSVVFFFFFFQLNLPSGTRTTKDRGPGHHRSFQRACTVRTRNNYWGARGVSASWRPREQTIDGGESV